MTVLNYSDRTLHGAMIYGISIEDGEAEGTSFVSGHVRLTLGSRDDPKLPGPTLVLELGVEVSSGCPVADVQDRMIDTAIALLGKFADFSAADIADAKRRSDESGF